MLKRTFCAEIKQKAMDFFTTLALKVEGGISVRATPLSEHQIA